MNVYCRDESQVWGPVLEAALRELLAAGIVTSHTDVRLEGRMRWETLGEVFPQLQLLLMLVLHHQATRRIRSAGFPAGFSGANLVEIATKLQPGQPRSILPSMSRWACHHEET
jgi:hypothetical protein